ncbi:MAG: 16S rRNA (adenine(1518)-N(6)/adenine(1519)-N(6))-dimethyltransferase RsmA [Elusimicrobiota bacterium]|jgi:16S rRNA (adenine1518-N6/adenine1519-N6)-dimethyltransferase|nr:16S rRNA (adenine(1518)-N(6)/adenine(1519)-N(6))-dimethyltransferase RsmA [Elusimicrobiota bacterium]
MAPALRKEGNYRALCNNGQSDKKRKSFMQKYGQHFLINRGIIDKITDAVVNNMQGGLVEIGPGKGALTNALLERGVNDFTLVEIDPKMISHLRDTLPPYARLNIIESDFLRLEPALLPEGDITFLSNLPYINAAEILLKVLETPCFKAAIFMFQREQAVRLCARPGTRQYGALSVIFQAFARARSICRVSAGSFSPPPKVDGEVLLITPAENKFFAGAKHKENFKELVKTVFAYRRKTVLNALVEVYGKNKDVLAGALNAAGVKISSRAEELAPARFADLARKLEGIVF